MTFIYPRPKRNKYGNTPCEALGIHFRSIKERNYAIRLEGWKSEGKIKGWQYEPRFDLFAYPAVTETVMVYHLAGKPSKVGFCKPDFLILNNNGTKEVHEIKQKYTKTRAWAFKKKVFEVNYPNIKYLVIEK